MIYRPVKHGKGFIKNDNPVEYADIGDKVKSYKNLYDVRKNLPKGSYDEIYIYNDEDNEVIDIIK